MKKSDVLELMDVLGISYPKKITAARAGEAIESFLEENGVPDEVMLTDEQVTYLETLGFSFDEEEEACDEEEEAMVTCAACGKEIAEEEAQVSEVTERAYCSKKCLKAAEKSTAPPKEKKPSAPPKEKGTFIANHTLVDQMLDEGASEKKIRNALKDRYVEKGKDPEADADWIEKRADKYLHEARVRRGEK